MLKVDGIPDLEKLHIIPKKKNTDIPDTEKYLVSLYSKKQAELDKALNFIKFHVRNGLNENTSIKMAANILETGTKVLEHALILVGLKVQGLSERLVNDKDVERCIREIMIESSISTLNRGPKADLTLKVMMGVVATDSNNRIMENGEEAYKQQQALQKKYEDI